MTRIFRLFPLADPSQAYLAASEARTPLRKILANLVQTFARAPKKAEKRIRMHDAVAKYPSVVDWGIEELREATFEEAVLAARKRGDGTLLNDGEGPAVVRKGGFAVVRMAVKDCPDFFCLRVCAQGRDPVADMFRRFRTLNAMNSTRGYIRIEYPEPLVKAVSRWYGEDRWAVTVVEPVESLTAGYKRLEALTKSLEPLLDGVEPTDPRGASLLRWLRDLSVPPLEELTDLDRSYAVAPRALPTPGFVAVLVQRQTHAEELFALPAGDASDPGELLRTIRAATQGSLTPEQWDQEYHVTPAVYCGDLVSARLAAAVTPNLAANWMQFCRDVGGVVKTLPGPLAEAF